MPLSVFYDLNGNLIRKDELWDEWTMSYWRTTVRWDYSWDHENRLIKVVQWKVVYDIVWGDYLDPWKRVEFYYCPACGGNRTQKVVYENDEWGLGSPDWTLTKWLRYETLGLDQLRVDEKYDADQDGLDEGEPFRTERVTYNSISGIGCIHNEILYTYSTPYTADSPTTEVIWYHYDRMMVVSALSNSSGTLIAGQRFYGDAFGQFEGSAAKTTRRITIKEYDQDIELYCFNLRWYIPTVARFSGKDRDERINGRGQHKGYVFCLNQPTSAVDWTGSQAQAAPAPRVVWIIVIRNAAIASQCDGPEPGPGDVVAALMLCHAAYVVSVAEKQNRIQK